MGCVSCKYSVSCCLLDARQMYLCEGCEAVGWHELYDIVAVLLSTDTFIGEGEGLDDERLNPKCFCFCELSASRRKLIPKTIYSLWMHVSTGLR